MKVLIDTNIALDVILEREPFTEPATEIFGFIEAGKLQGFTDGSLRYFPPIRLSLGLW